MVPNLDYSLTVFLNEEYELLHLDNILDVLHNIKIEKKRKNSSKMQILKQH